MERPTPTMKKRDEREVRLSLKWPAKQDQLTGFIEALLTAGCEVYCAGQPCYGLAAADLVDLLKEHALEVRLPGEPLSLRLSSVARPGTTSSLFVAVSLQEGLLIDWQLGFDGSAEPAIDYGAVSSTLTPYVLEEARQHAAGLKICAIVETDSAIAMDRESYFAPVPARLSGEALAA